MTKRLTKHSTSLIRSLIRKSTSSLQQHRQRPCIISRLEFFQIISIYFADNNQKSNKYSSSSFSETSYY